MSKDSGHDWFCVEDFFKALNDLKASRETVTELEQKLAEKDAELARAWRLRVDSELEQSRIFEQKLEIAKKALAIHDDFGSQTARDALAKL